MEKLKKVLGVTQLSLIMIALIASFGCVWFDFMLSLKILLSAFILIFIGGAFYSLIKKLDKKESIEKPIKNTFQERLEELRKQNENN